MKRDILTDLSYVLEEKSIEISEFLCDLIRFPSTGCREKEISDYIYRRFSELVPECEQVPITPSIEDDTEFSFKVEGTEYGETSNVRVCILGSGDGRSVILNAHMDVVPPSSTMKNPYEPRVDNGIIYGRGAEDDKGGIASFFGMVLAMRELSLTPAGDVILHMVTEEENGGNGTLAMIRYGDRADGMISGEPAGFNVYTSVRGAVWFDVRIEGHPAHSGSPGESISALMEARKAMNALEAYHAELLGRSKGIPLFDDYENPMPLTFGELHTGDWPAIAPAESAFRGVMGFLTNVTREQVMRDIEDVIKGASDWLRDHTKIKFLYRHDACVTDPDDSFVVAVIDAARRSGLEPKILANPASNDMWFYRNFLGIPAVKFGPGTGETCHKDNEQIRLDDVLKMAEVYVRFIMDWGSERKRMST